MCREVRYPVRSYLLEPVYSLIGGCRHAHLGAMLLADSMFYTRGLFFLGSVLRKAIGLAFSVFLWYWFSSVEKDESTLSRSNKEQGYICMPVSLLQVCRGKTLWGFDGNSREIYLL